MSAFVVEEATINNVVSYVQRYRFSDDLEQWPIRTFEEHGCLDDETEPCDLAAALFQMNVDAVEQRYGHGEAEKFRPLDYHYHYTDDWTNTVVLKAARCLLYQCSEGFVVYRPLYKALDLFSLRLAFVIVRQTKAYDEAPWG